MLGAMTPRAIYTALKSGKMQTQAQTLSDEQRREVCAMDYEPAICRNETPEGRFCPFLVTEISCCLVGLGW